LIRRPADFETWAGCGILRPLKHSFQEGIDMKKYIVERDLPGVGGMSDEELGGATSTSNEALAQLPGKVQWQHSYVAGDKTFCVYLATDEGAIRKHAEISGFPATVVTEVKAVIDPTTGQC
jgi:hypothetical protein